MKTFNIKYQSDEKLVEFINKNLKNCKNILIQIFSGVLDKDKIKHILDILNSNLDATIIGASTDGEILEDKILEKNIVISFSCFEDTTINSFILSDIDEFNLGIKASEFVSNNSKLLITFAAGLDFNAEKYLKGIESKSDILIAGGLAGDNAEFRETFVFNNDKIITNGVVGVVLNSKKLIVNNAFGFNWQGIGKILTITKAKDNIVYEIDGQKAVDIYKYYLGDMIGEKLPAVGIEFPLIIKRDNLNVARAVIDKNEDGSLVFAGNFKNGDKVQLGYGNVEAIITKTNEVLKSIKDLPIESIFMYSCMARRRFLGDKIKYEIKPFSDIASLSGFFTYGEFFKAKNIEFFNQTATIITLSESKKISKKKISKIELQKDSVLTLNALSHLIDITTKELKDMNDVLNDKVKIQSNKIKAKNLEIEYMFYHDSLTDLPNKNELEKDLKELTIITGSLLIDIKKFSLINDMYGDIVGDEILKSFANYLKDLTKPYGCKLYRVAADQFMTLNLTNHIGLCQKIANEIFDYLHNNTLCVRADYLHLDIELGVCIAMVGGDYFDKNVKIKADMTLNHAKKNNKEFLIYSKDLKLEENIQTEIETIAMVKKALQEDRVIPVFQRIKKDEDSFECLVRIKEKDKLISPFFFLDTIKNTKYYFDITKVMIYKSFEYFKNRKESFSINLSYRDMMNEDIIEYLIEYIEKYSMYNRVIVELLESEAINDFNKIKEFIQTIKKYGVKIAIDDFGSGYSNFIYLTELKPDFIKIDGSLIKNINQDEESLIITKNITNFAKELGYKVIAEFVSSKEIYDIVQNLKIDGIQGYYIAEPKENV